MTTKLKDVLNPEKARAAHLAAKIRQLERDNKTLLEQRGKYSELISDLIKAVPAVDPYPQVPLKASPAGATPIHAVVKVSDWQIGEVVSSAETGGFGVFNFALAEKRVFLLAQKLIDWTAMHRQGGYNVPELHVFSEADLVSGNIHYELEVTNEFPAPVAAEKAGYLLAEFVARLAPHFEKVTVHEVNADNHGRLTRKNQYKQGALNNWSYLAHVIANSRLASVENVQTIMSEGVKMIARVNGKNYLLCHGHHILSNLGIPFYGVSRDRAREAIKRMHAKPSEKFDYISMGHFHVPTVLENAVLINGNLVGSTEMDSALGRFTPPAQVSFMSHRKHGLFGWVPWNLS